MKNSAVDVLSPTPGKGLSIALWTTQTILAVLFLFAGVMKFLMPVKEMTKNSSLPGSFFHFIGVMEVLGGIGLVLPSLLRISPFLTPVAACGLVIIHDRSDHNIYTDGLDFTLSVLDWHPGDIHCIWPLQAASDSATPLMRAMPCPFADAPAVRSPVKRINRLIEGQPPRFALGLPVVADGQQVDCKNSFVARSQKCECHRA